MKTSIKKKRYSKNNNNSKRRIPTRRSAKKNMIKIPLNKKYKKGKSKRRTIPRKKNSLRKQRKYSKIRVIDRFNDNSTRSRSGNMNLMDKKGKKIRHGGTKGVENIEELMKENEKVKVDLEEAGQIGLHLYEKNEELAVEVDELKELRSLQEQENARLHEQLGEAAILVARFQDRGEGLVEKEGDNSVLIEELRHQIEELNVEKTSLLGEQQSAHRTAAELEALRDKVDKVDKVEALEALEKVEAQVDGLGRDAARLDNVNVGSDELAETRLAREEEEAARIEAQKQNRVYEKQVQLVQEAMQAQDDDFKRLAAKLEEENARAAAITNEDNLKKQEIVDLQAKLASMGRELAEARQLAGACTDPVEGLSLLEQFDPPEAQQNSNDTKFINLVHEYLKKI
jgi:hypothetical protein